MTKVCKNCKIIKPISDFYKKRTAFNARCKQCLIAAYPRDKEKSNRSARMRYQLNKTKNQERRKLYRIKNKEKAQLAEKQYRIKNKELVNARSRSWRERNKQYDSLRNSIYQKKRRQTDINYALKIKLRNRLRDALRGNFKIGSSVRDLGCSIDFFKSYLQSKFEPGMTWENQGRSRGQWQIDHIIPLSSFDLTKREEFLKACHYSNMQPLWMEQNNAKHNRTPEEWAEYQKAKKKQRI